MQTHKSKEAYRRQLVRLIATSLGLYMRARMYGLPGESQLSRHKRLGEALKEFDSNNIHIQKQSNYDYTTS